ncbi:MAG: tripartite tricarboxylate transporter TctB family protein [Jannaschia sp.]
MTAPASSSAVPVRSPLRVGLAAGLLGLALILLVHTYADRYTGGMWATAPNAMALPRALLSVWAGLAGVVLVAEWRGRVIASADDIRAVLWIAALLVAGAALLPWIGFLMAITPVVAGCLLALGERRPLVLILATAFLGPGVWALFHHALLIRLPSVLPGGLL